MSHKAHRMLIRKLLTRKKDLWYSQYSTLNYEKYRLKSKMAVIVVLFSVNIFKLLDIEHFVSFKVCLSCQELSTECTMNSVRYFWSFDPNGTGHWPGSPRGETKFQNLAAIFGQRVSGMELVTLNLLASLYAQKRVFWTPICGLCCKNTRMNDFLPQSYHYLRYSSTQTSLPVSKVPLGTFWVSSDPREYVLNRKILHCA